MRVILGLDAPDAGTALIGGRPYRSLRRPLSQVGALLDAGALQPGRSGRNHLLWLARSQGLPARRVDEVIADDDLTPAIRLRHRVTAACWSTEAQRWTVDVTREDTGQQLRFTAGFLYMCPGYYNHARPYRPQWDGMDRFEGVIDHNSAFAE